MKKYNIVLENALKDPTYCPYCMRCDDLVRMKKIEHLYWKCNCGAVHDERNNHKANVNNHKANV